MTKKYIKIVDFDDQTIYYLNKSHFLQEFINVDDFLSANIFRKNAHSELIVKENRLVKSRAVNMEMIIDKYVDM